MEFRRVPFDAEEWIGVTAKSGRPFADKIRQEYSAKI